MPVPLTAAGEEASRRLGQQLAGAAFDVCVHTRFERTRRTAELALAGRDVPFLVEPGLDDVRLGELEGGTVEAYRAWKAAHARGEQFPGGGESLVEVAHRYAAALRRVVELPADSVLVVCHELPVRYALNAVTGSDQLDRPLHDIPNATPYLFDADVLAAAAEQIELLAD